MTNKLKSPKFTCPVCGKVFERSFGTVKYCSDECRNKANQMNYEIRAKQAIEAYIPKTVICKICGKPVPPNRGRSKRYARKHIHEECIINDTINTLLSGKKISSCQMTRLVTRGLSVQDIREEMRIREEKGNEELHIHT